MIPAGQFDGAPGAGLGHLGVVHSLTMPVDAGAGAPFRFGGALRGLRGTAADGPVYAAATLVGAGLGGALIGWVAADSKQGAFKAAAFASGMTGFSTGLATWSTQKLLGATLVAGGLGGMLWAVKDRIKHRRR